MRIEHRDRRARRVVEDPAGRLQAVEAGHLDVHQHDVGPPPACEVHRVEAVDRLADHLDVRLRLEDRAEARAHERLVVGDQHGDRHRGDATGRRRPRHHPGGGTPRSLARMMPAALRGVTIAVMAPVPRPWLDWAIAAALTAIGIAMTLDPANGDGTIVDTPRDRRRHAAGDLAPPRAAARRGRAGRRHGRERHPDVRPGALRRRDPGRAADPVQRRRAAAAGPGAGRARADPRGDGRAAVHRSAARRRRRLHPPALRRRLVDRAASCARAASSRRSWPSARSCSRRRARSTPGSPSRATARSSRRTSSSRRGDRCARMVALAERAGRRQPRAGPRGVREHRAPGTRVAQ